MSWTVKMAGTGQKMEFPRFLSRGTNQPCIFFKRYGEVIFVQSDIGI